MPKINRCKFDLHYWRYNPEGRLRFCDCCGLEQSRTRNMLFNRWVVRQRKMKIS